ncbi:tyrosine-type recombinase/integrase [Aquabacterium commune]|uniref:tyrosine-type recombinase/integrase n=1 Tax=Aquabacterium commune TaxID=70586 RepID=UPI00312C7615
MEAITTIDQVLIPVHLTGVDGGNRGRGQRQVQADDDYSAVLSWLARYADTPATLSAYRKEAERLLLWCVHQRGLAMSSLAHEDLLLYERFLTDPQPAARWVMTVRQRPGRDSPHWRPFAGPLSPASQRQALSILNAMFSWLVEAGYLAGNPLSLGRRRQRSGPKQTNRFLPHEHWTEVKATILSMPAESAREVIHGARCRWLFSLLYIGGLRVSEINSSTMGSFYLRKDRSGVERWWLEVVGKGSKSRTIPATAELMVELVNYRKVIGMPALPSANEFTPLVLPIIGRGKPLARSAIHEIVKEVMRNTAQRLRAQGAAWEGVASQIEAASTHWLRHTAGTHMTDAGLAIKSVRDNFGHATISTTSIYVHSEDDARHDATQAAHRIGWEVQPKVVGST